MNKQQINWMLKHVLFQKHVQHHLGKQKNGVNQHQMHYAIGATMEGDAKKAMNNAKYSSPFLIFFHSLLFVTD